MKERASVLVEIVWGPHLSFFAFSENNLHEENGWVKQSGCLELTLRDNFTHGLENDMPTVSSQGEALMMNPVDSSINFSDSNLHKELLLMA